MTSDDRHLGMGTPITRRDFLNGVAIGAGGVLASRLSGGPIDALLAQTSAPYPPALTGLRGSHAGSFEALHALREGTLPTIALSEIRGLVTFPSFHACLAVLTAWALAPVPVIGPLAALLNGAILVATLGAGGHYLPDVLAGTLMGIFLVVSHGARHRRSSGARRAVRVAQWGRTIGPAPGPRSGIRSIDASGPAPARAR